MKFIKRETKMTVKEFLSKITDSYQEIAINEYDGREHTGRWLATPHSVNYASIPEKIRNREISAIIPYYGRISVEVEKQK